MAPHVQADDSLAENNKIPNAIASNGTFLIGPPREVEA
jgi:hypothetical protein